MVALAMCAALALLARSDARLPVGDLACVIKGNVSSSGERVYHVPGQRYCDATRISARKGERWFCSEAEARRAGWRRART
ncbi:MAG: hypothetical protein F4X99_02370 [Gammaproteobacteria bacterium]|nr:hypothetical protein [Gammaproteobacteria bacterium]